VADPASTFAAVGALATGAGALVTGVGAFVALLAFRKNVEWKKAELASNYLKELLSNQELVFACRCIDWRAGKLVVPEQLRPLLPNEAKVIEHDYRLLERALDPRLGIAEMATEPRLQLYRTAMDGLLSWINLVDNAIGRRLFGAREMPEMRYWLARIRETVWIAPFAETFGYSQALQRMNRAFRLT
jgi:hypothetical protein